MFSYKVDNFYAPQCDRGIRFDDPDIAINWGFDKEKKYQIKIKNSRF
ncbi:MAG: dTDP-4-dehydrorhamnose 3,5-epimerase family protein [bacterium]